MHEVITSGQVLQIVFALLGVAALTFAVYVLRLVRGAMAEDHGARVAQSRQVLAELAAARGELAAARIAAVGLSQKLVDLALDRRPPVSQARPRRHACCGCGGLCDSGLPCPMADNCRCRSGMAPPGHPGEDPEAGVPTTYFDRTQLSTPVLPGGAP